MEKSLMRTIIIATALSGCVAMVMASIIVRMCLGTGFRFDTSPASFLCGSAPAGTTADNFKRLIPSEMSVVSNIPERADLSIAEGRGAEKLIDGSEKTLAAPGNNAIDYSINLLDTYEIKQITIVWGDYGINSNYVRSWSLESSSDGLSWEAVQKGGSPAGSQTVIETPIKASHLRLKAEAEKDWIGAYELEVIARAAH